MGGMMDIGVKIYLAGQVQILEFVSISQCAGVLEKGMNPTVLLASMGKFWDRLGSLAFVKTKIQVEGKTIIYLRRFTAFFTACTMYKRHLRVHLEILNNLEKLEDSINISNK